MKLSKIVFSFLIVASAFAAGCSSTEADVESLCEDAKECKDADAFFQDLDCAKFAKDTVEAADRLGCSSEYSDLVDCQSGIDVCADHTAADPCPAETKAVATCSQAYCNSNPEDEACGSTDETSG